MRTFYYEYDEVEKHGTFLKTTEETSTVLIMMF
jgi:hypothetical protein